MAANGENLPWLRLYFAEKRIGIAVYPPVISLPPTNVATD